MESPPLDSNELEAIEAAVAHFAKNESRFKTCAANLYNFLMESDTLRPLIHSSKSRVKDRGHLRNKLIRKAQKAKADGKNFEVNPANLFTLIEDLAGVRLIHLHTTQMAKIVPIIAEILEEAQYRVLEGPTARTWDSEYQAFFRSIGVKTEIEVNSMYTSVHYIIEENSKSKLRCELQVRTLSEELWGEVSHTIDYPTPTSSIACKEQLKVLARLTSASTRLVDSLFKSKEEHLNIVEMPSTPTGSVLAIDVQESKGSGSQVVPGANNDRTETSSASSIVSSLVPDDTPVAASPPPGTSNPQTAS